MEMRPSRYKYWQVDLTGRCQAKGDAGPGNGPISVKGSESVEPQLVQSSRPPDPLSTLLCVVVYHGRHGQSSKLTDASHFFFNLCQSES